jgi:hypothetical protein
MPFMFAFPLVGNIIILHDDGLHLAGLKRSLPRAARAHIPSDDGG